MAVEGRESSLYSCRCNHPTSIARSGSSIHKSRGTVPGTPSSAHWSQTHGSDLPFEPIDPFKPSLAYSVRHICPKSPSILDPDPIIAALLSPCGVLSTSRSTRSLTSNKCTIHSAGTSASTGHRQIFTAERTDASQVHANHIESAEIDEKSSTRTHRLHHHASRAENPQRQKPYYGHLPSPYLRSPSTRVQFCTVIRSDSQDSAHHPDDIAAEHFSVPKTPTSSASFVSDLVRSYSRNFSPSTSPTLFAGSIRSALPQILESQPQLTAESYQIVTVQDRVHSAMNSPTTPKTSSRQEQSQEGITISIRSNYLYTTPRLHSPPKSRSRRALRPRNNTSPQSVPTAKVSDAEIPNARKTFATRTYIIAFLIDTLPRQIYLYLLLWIPYMYFSRVANIFEEAELSLPKIKQGIIEATRKEKGSAAADIHRTWRFEPPTTPSIAYFNLQKTWEQFVDSLMSEWQTLNIISVLLMSAIIAILQIAAPSSDPLTHYFALLSLICALMSLIYGCVYIIRFGSMRKAFKAAMWAAEAQRSTTCILWNVWVFLAMPATWLAWSMISFIVCIMSLIWRTGTAKDADSMTMTIAQARLPRIAITVVLGIGVIYFMLILKTLRRYGKAMDRKWHKIVAGWISTQHTKRTSAKSSFPLPSSRLGHDASRAPFSHLHSPLRREYRAHGRFPISASTKSSEPG